MQSNPIGLEISEEETEKLRFPVDFVIEKSRLEVWQIMCILNTLKVF